MHHQGLRKQRPASYRHRSQHLAMRHDTNQRMEATPMPKPRFLVVERSDNRQDYTIHPYFVLGTAFPPQPSSSCPGPSLQSLSIPVISLRTVIPPSVRGHPSIPLLPLSLTMSICINHGLYTYPTTSIPL
jgi:hypothetical protein